MVGPCGSSWCSSVVVLWCGWLLLSGCHVIPGGCPRGGLEGGCASLPGLGMTSSPSSLPVLGVHACWWLVTWCSGVVLVVAVGGQ